jgi:mono/diheme cytochrome c family protein
MLGMTQSFCGSFARLALVLSVLFVVGCGKGSESQPEPSAAGSPSAEAQPAPASPEAAGGAAAEAKEIFETRCSSCHGEEGRGNGPASAVLNPKPQNFHDPKWQASVTDEQLTQAIIYGGAAVGKSPAMAANPDLQEKPEVVKALIAQVRALGKQK